jgi:hypothetical protein
VPGLLLGTSFSGRADAAGREAPARASLRALEQSGAAVFVELRFADDSPAGASVVLRRDARSAAGVDGARKPLVSEMLDVLATEAERRGLSRIGIVNADIIVLPEAVTHEVARTAAAAAFSRTDVGGGLPDQPLLYGVDMVTFDVAFWRRHRRRFRSYILGEPTWDNVYTAVIASHGGVLLNRERLLLHERHPSRTANSPYARYLQVLAARDRSYFSRWCEYVWAAEQLRARGGSAAEEFALQRTIFRPPTLPVEAMDVARGSWWRLKRALGA